MLSVINSFVFCRTLCGEGNPAQWPDRNRYVELLFIDLCRLFPADEREHGSRTSRWALILAAYSRIRDCVLSHFRVLDETSIQLYEVNTPTLTQWYNHREKSKKTIALNLDVSAPPDLVAESQLPPAHENVRVPSAPAAKPLQFNMPADTTGMAGRTKAGPSKTPCPRPQQLRVIVPKPTPVSTSS